MLTLWIVVGAIGALEVVETVLLVLLLRALGKLKQQGAFSTNQAQPFDPGGLNVGEKAPSFVATDDEGNTFRLEDFEGQRRILTFVSPGCPSCAGAIDALNAILQHEQDLAVFVVGDRDREQNRAYAHEHGARMPILTPASTDIREMYHVHGIPFVFVLDEAAVIRARGNANTVEHVQDLLKEAFTLVSFSH